MSQTKRSALSMGVLSMAMVASIATSDFKDFFAEAIVAVNDIQLVTPVPAHQFKITVDADPSLRDESTQKLWHLNFELEVENRGEWDEEAFLACDAWSKELRWLEEDCSAGNEEACDEWAAVYISLAEECIGLAEREPVSISIYQLESAWAGGDLPETATLVGEAGVGFEAFQQPVSVWMSDYDTPDFDRPMFYVLVADTLTGELELEVSAVLYMSVEDWSSSPSTNATFTMTVE